MKNQITIPKKRYDEMMSLVWSVAILGAGMKIGREMESLSKKLANEGVK
jgi:hypothetical protein